MKELFKKALRFFKARPYSAILLLWPWQIIWYSVLNRLVVQDPAASRLIHIDLDDKIPYLNFFSVFYTLWFVFIAVCIVYVLIHSKKDFLRCATGCLFTMYVCMIFCTVFPTYHDLRAADTGCGLFGLIVKIIYSVDEPAVVYPSIHVVVSIVLALRMTFAESLKNKPVRKALVWFMAIMITLSTVFIKQHSAADVILALVLAVPFDLFVRFVIWPDKRFKERPASAEKGVPAAESD